MCYYTEDFILFEQLIFGDKLRPEHVSLQILKAEILFSRQLGINKEEAGQNINA